MWGIVVEVGVFRFHTGSIKRIKVVNRIDQPLEFRFHTGSIKRHLKLDVFG